MFAVTEAPWLDGLNDRQREAVLDDGPALLIVAGAGSGKTRTLAARVARLLAEGAAPDRILLVTFSRRAARELLLRAERMTGGATKVWGGTFHAVANRLLRQHAPALGLPSAFTVLDSSDAIDLFGLVRTELGLAQQSRRFPKRQTLASIYSRLVNAQVPLSEVLSHSFPWCAAEIDGIRAAFEAYTERKREQGVLDFDDLLLYARVLVQDPATAAAVHDRFDHILVDEYQDTNRLQADLLAGLAAGGARVCAVGDDAQAIYGFRAGSADHLAELPERFAGTTVVTLDQSYRSTEPILDLANALLDQQPGRFPRRLWGERGGNAKPVLAVCADEAGQVVWVCEQVLERADRGIPLREQAVLFRTGHHSDGLEVELARRNIPFHKYGGLKFLEAGHVKDLVALLRVLDNPRDELAWQRVLEMLDGIGPAKARRIADDLGVGRDDAALRRLFEQPPAVPESAAEELLGLSAALEACAGEPEPPVVAQVDVLQRWCAPVFARRYASAGTRVEDLVALGGMATAHSSRRHLLSDLALDPPASTSELAGPPHLDDDYLVLSTIHSAKGGEWRAVHVIHVADGNLPSDMAISDSAGLEEERRLLYVALTRAKESLAVSYPLRFYHRRHGMDDAHTYGQPSRFVVPMRHLFDEVHVGLPSPAEPVAADGDRRIRSVPATREVSSLLGSLWSA